MDHNEKYFNDSLSQQHNIEEVLVDNEKVLWRGKPQGKAYVWSAVLKMLPIALIWLLFDGTFIYFMATSDDFPKEMLWFVVPFFALHLAPVWIWIGGIIKAVGELKHMEYAITDKRTIIRTGMIGVDFKFIPHTEVDTVNVKIGWLDKLCGVGDVYINSKSNAGVLHDLPDSVSVAKNLQKIIQDQKADLNYPNQLRPDQNNGYNTNYNYNNFDDGNNE